MDAALVYFSGVHRLFTLLLLLGVLAGLLSGRFVHIEHHVEYQGHHAGGATACATDRLADSCAPSGDSHHHEGQGLPGESCHQHACHHSISPGISTAFPGFVSASLLLGSVPAVPVAAIDEPVDEPDTPPLI